MKTTHYRTLVPVADCLSQLHAPDWVAIDCRFQLAEPQWGLEAYREGHLPGAHFADLERDLSGHVGAGSGRHPLPDWRRFAESLARWGVRHQSQVVLYDQGGGAFAARLWWMLRAVGHERAAVLDGGWPAWLAAGGAQSRETPLAGGSAVQFHPGTGWVTSEAVERNLVEPRFLLVDARSAERFAGLSEPIDPVAGHIPGARNRPFELNLADNGCFLAPAALRTQWLECLDGVECGDVVHMCGSGVTACHNLLAMEHAGLGGSRLYVGSWSEWLRERRRPVATARA